MPLTCSRSARALLAGLFGGVHCLAMCGGIAVGFAAPRGEARCATRCCSTPAASAATCSPARWSAASAPRCSARAPAGLALAMRSLVGAVLLLAAFRLLQPQRAAWLGRPRNGSGAAAAAARARAGARRRGAAAGARLFWGWLPCGLSTTLLAAAWLQASALHGALLMLAFGLGTLPLMLSLSWSGARLAGHCAQPGIRHGAAALIALAGVATLAGPWLAHAPCCMACSPRSAAARWPEAFSDRELAMKSTLPFRAGRGHPWRCRQSPTRRRRPAPTVMGNEPLAPGKFVWDAKRPAPGRCSWR
jgi:sulfite exporter TauE/SafE